jgi:Chaperone of endosialidase
MGTPTPNKGFTLPTVGGDFNTWGGELNGNFSILDNNLGGAVNVPVTGTSVTLTSTQLQSLFVGLTGSPSGNFVAAFPVNNGIYIISNNNTGGFTATISNGGAQDITLANGQTALLLMSPGGVFWPNSAPLVAEGGLSVSGGPISLTGNSVEVAGGGVNTTGDINVSAGVINVNGGSIVAISGAGRFGNSGGTTGFSGSVPVAFNANAGGVASLAFYATSDGRIKTDIEPITAGMAFTWVNDARPVTFEMNGQKGAGFIAQQDIVNGRGAAVAMVPDLRPEVAIGDGYAPDGFRLIRNYNHDIGYLTAALQDIYRRVETLEAEI